MSMDSSSPAPRRLSPVGSARTTHHRPIPVASVRIPDDPPGALRAHRLQLQIGMTKDAIVPIDVRSHLCNTDSNGWPNALTHIRCVNLPNEAGLPCRRAQ
jgi:hypothetical protein